MPVPVGCIIAAFPVSFINILDVSDYNENGYLKIKANNPVHIWSTNDIISFILIIVFILAILAIIIVLITSFIKDIRRKKKEDELGEIKLRRRKF